MISKLYAIFLYPVGHNTESCDLGNVSCSVWLGSMLLRGTGLIEGVRVNSMASSTQLPVAGASKRVYGYRFS